MLLAVLGCGLQIVQPLAETIDVRLERLDLLAEFAVERCNVLCYKPAKGQQSLVICFGENEGAPTHILPTPS